MKLNELKTHTNYHQTKYQHVYNQIYNNIQDQIIYKIFHKITYQIRDQIDSYTFWKIHNKIVNLTDLRWSYLYETK